MAHAIETCPDDNETLRIRLDELSAQGARILAVLWQPRRPAVADQAGAFDSSGAYVIVSEMETEQVLRSRDTSVEELRA